MHKLLARQLHAAARKDGGGVDIDRLIAIVDEAYEEFDRERRLNDRAATLMEEELRSANAEAQRDHYGVLAAILHNASDGMLVVGEQGLIASANPAAERQFAAAPDGLASLPIADLLGAAAFEASRGKTPQNQVQEGTATALGGRRFPVEYSVAPLELSGETRQLWIVRDISERVRIQREIMDTQMRFQDFAEASSDCFWEMDAALEKVSVTSSLEPELPELISTLLTPPPGGGAPAGVDKDSWLPLREQILVRQWFRRRICVNKDNGEAVHLSVTGKPVCDRNGAFRGYRGTVRDITREVVAREAAQRAEQRLIEAMDAAPSAVVLLGQNLHFVGGNSALKALARRSGVSLEPDSPFAGFLARALNGGKDAAADPAATLRALAASNDMREVSIGGCWYLLAARELSDGGMVLTFSDVTMLKQREYELAEAKVAAESASRLKSQFLATMSHELRTPLNAILGFSEVIRDAIFGHDESAAAKYAEYADSIHTSGKHLLSLISEILDLSKIEAGTYVLAIETLDLRDILQGALTIIGPAAKKAGIELRTNFPADEVLVAGDDRALRQIALNLLANAVKFTPPGGSVALDVTSKNGMVEFSVTDTGIGIAKEHVGTVFELFRQVDASIRRRHEGTGLGLAITKRLVEMHGGTIGLESELAVGTSVHVRLPASGAHATALPAEAAA